MTLVEKYENYRKILTGQFLASGLGQGFSLPADAIQPGSMHFGDSTLFLGWYIGVLATEYHLLTSGIINSPTLNVPGTLRELSLALRALRRLSRAAAGCFPQPPASLPAGAKGFFIRDDVDDGFKTHFPGVTEIKSDYTAASPFDKEESQDQLIHLLLGLSLVKKYIPPRTFQLVLLLIMAQDLALKISSWPAQTKWVIRNPYLGGMKVHRGPYARPFSYPISAAVQKIHPRGADIQPSVRRLWKFLWKYVMRHGLGFFYNPTNLHLVSTLASISDSWGPKSLKHIIRRSKKFDWPIYPMLNVVLFTDQAPNKLDYKPELLARAEPMLDMAPENGLSQQGSPPGWKASHRFIFGRDEQDRGQDHYAGRDFSGLDFMLLHNLYQILRAL